MSTLAIAEVATRPTVTRPRWQHVPSTRGPVARPHHPGAPGGRPAVLPAPLVRAAAPARVVVGEGLTLTRRGLAVAVTLFLGVAAAAALTLVTSFFGVSNEPPAGWQPTTAVTSAS